MRWCASIVGVRQPEWRVSLEVLREEGGISSPRRVFRAMLRDVIETGNIPDYVLVLDADDLLHVTPRAVVVEAGQGAGLLQTTLGPLAEATLDQARRLARGWDIYALEAEWRDMWHRLVADAAQPRQGVSGLAGQAAGLAAGGFRPQV